MDVRSYNARRLAADCALVLLVLAAFHLLLRWLMLSTGLVLGAVGPGTKVYRLAPLYMHWRPHFKLGLVVAMAVLAAFVWFFRRMAWQSVGPAVVGDLASTGRRLPEGEMQTRTGHPARLLLLLMLWHILIAACVAMIDGGPKQLFEPYLDYSETDYFGGLLRASIWYRDSPDPVRDFLGDYVSKIPDLPMHCQTHPPGAVLFLWTICSPFANWAWAGALGTIVASSLAVPAVYGLAREVLRPRPALLAAALFMLAPNVVLFSATSMDAVFCVPMVWTFYLLWRARRGQAVLFGALGGLAAGAAALFTFSAAFLGVWGLAALVLSDSLDQPHRNRFLAALAAAGATSLAFFSVLYLWSGYHLIENLFAAMGQHRAIMSGANHATWQQYFHLSVANLVAFFAAAGVPLCALFLRQAWGWIAGWAVRHEEAEAIESTGSSQGTEVPYYEREVSYHEREAYYERSAALRSGRVLGLSFLVSLLVIDALPLYTLEVDHIWLFMVPFLAIAAAARLTAGCRADDTRLPSAAVAALVLLALQTIVMETLLHTMW